jgi:hypothetical protein
MGGERRQTFHNGLLLWHWCLSHQPGCWHSQSVTCIEPSSFVIGGCSVRFYALTARLFSRNSFSCLMFSTIRVVELACTAFVV